MNRLLIKFFIFDAQFYVLAMKDLYRNIHSFSKIAVIALVALISLVVFMVLTAILAIPIFGTEVFTGLVSSTIDFNEANIGLLKFFQLGQSIGLFIVPALVLAVLFGGNIGQYLLLNKKPFLKSAVLATLVVLSASPFINVLGIWNAQMELPGWMSGIEAWMKQSEESAAKLTELFVTTDNIGGLLFNIFLIGIIPAIGEELLFRGVIQRVITDWSKNKHVAIWVTAILFSALHMQFYGFIPRAILGALFGYLLVWSGNLWLPVIAHFINNTAAVIAYYLYDNGLTKVDPDMLGVDSAYGVTAIVSGVVMATLCFIYYRYEKSRQLEY